MSPSSQERKADALREGGLVTYKDQLSYGLHVIVVMGVFYAIGHLAAASMSSKTSVVCSSCQSLPCIWTCQSKGLRQDGIDCRKQRAVCWASCLPC